VDLSGLPAINALVDVSLASGATYPSRIEGVAGDLLQVAAPLDQNSPVQPGAALEVAWLRDGGRVAAPARLTGITDDHSPCWEVQVLGDARRQTRRGYVRGGGGEPILFRPAGGERTIPPVDGVVIDIGEASVRARLRMCDFERGDLVEVSVNLGGDRPTLTGPVLDVRHMKQTGHFDIIVAFEPDESLCRVIRSYILRRQLEERRRSG
jgi:hypothetical protein